MKKAVFAVLMAFGLVFTLPSGGSSLNLAKMPMHYISEMEFYYIKPRPEMLGSMLASFDRANMLANAEKRLFVAAFLSALAGKGEISLKDYAGGQNDPARDLRITMAWAAHLCASADENEILAMLPGGKDSVLAKQISQSPKPLAAWDPGWEKSVLNMYWAAFMATGESVWLDRIIKTALGYAHNQKGGSDAAASLYDYAPRHALICARLKIARATAPESEQAVIDTILRHAEKYREKAFSLNTSR